MAFGLQPLRPADDARTDRAGLLLGSGGAERQWHRARLDRHAREWRHGQPRPDPPTARHARNRHGADLQRQRPVEHAVGQPRHDRLQPHGDGGRRQSRHCPQPVCPQRCRARKQSALHQRSPGHRRAHLSLRDRRDRRPARQLPLGGRRQTLPHPRPARRRGPLRLRQLPVREAHAGAVFRHDHADEPDLGRHQPAPAGRPDESQFSSAVHLRPQSR